jgi:iron-sulfur cluster insertion protein
MNATITPSYLDTGNAPLFFTEAAAGKVRELIAEEGNPEL